MKITKRQLRRIIRESYTEEQKAGMRDYGHKFDKAFKRHDGAYHGHPDDVSLLDLDDYDDLNRAMQSMVKQQTAAGYTKEDVVAALKTIIEDL